MTTRATAPWTVTELRREIDAWIAYYAHALPRPAPEPAGAEHLTARMILDALDARLDEALALDGGAPSRLYAALALAAAARRLRTELALAPGRGDEPTRAAQEAAGDLFMRALAGERVVQRHAA